MKKALLLLHTTQGKYQNGTAISAREDQDQDQLKLTLIVHRAGRLASYDNLDLTALALALWLTGP